MKPCNLGADAAQRHSQHFLPLSPVAVLKASRKGHHARKETAHAGNNGLNVLQVGHGQFKVLAVHDADASFVAVGDFGRGVRCGDLNGNFAVVIEDFVVQAEPRCAGHRATPAFHDGIVLAGVPNESLPCVIPGASSLDRRELARIATEAYVSRYYLSISCWAEAEGLSGAAAFFRAHHESEELHMHKMMDYVLERGGRVVVGPVEAPPTGFETMYEALQASLEQEQRVSADFNDTVDAFLNEKDHQTVNFLQWFVAEQHEEESLFRTLIAKAELIGDEPRGRFWLDRELGEAGSKEAAQAEPPA